MVVKDFDEGNDNGKQENSNMFGSQHSGDGSQNFQIGSMINSAINFPSLGSYNSMNVEDLSNSLSAIEKAKFKDRSDRRKKALYMILLALLFLLLSGYYGYYLINGGDFRLHPYIEKIYGEDMEGLLDRLWDLIGFVITLIPSVASGGAGWSLLVNKSSFEVKANTHIDAIGDAAKFQGTDLKGLRKFRKLE